MRILALVILVNISFAASVHEHDGMPPDAHLGTVSFPLSCDPALQADFNRAVALLHSFWHNEAQRVFESVAASDPACAMAYWGEAMSHFHLGLSWPTPGDLAAGADSLTKAETAAQKTAHEAAYIHALRELYDGFKPEDAWTHFARYADALGAIEAAYPDDLEAKVFHAMALTLAQPPGDTDLIQVKKAVAILTPLLPEYPDHPGIAHYLIHACDTPGLAAEGLEAARRYAKIAPASPHALHMPSHIFTRLGLWQEDISSNLASKAAAERTEGLHAGAENRLHAMEFLEYAYLQIGHDREAAAVVDEAKTVAPSEVDPRVGNYYSLVETRFPTMLAIETRDWRRAADCEPVKSEDGADRYLTLLAHAMAAGHLHDRAVAKTTWKAAQSFDQERRKGKPLPRSGSPESAFLDQVHAWTDFAEGDFRDAVSLLRPIADRQDKVGKGELDLPMRESIADILLSSGKAHEALVEYQHSLQIDPNRFNGLLGAGRAAEQSGQNSLAVDYYRTLLANCDGASGAALKELEHARSIAR